MPTPRNEGILPLTEKIAFFSLGKDLKRREQLEREKGAGKGPGSRLNRHRPLLAVSSPLSLLIKGNVLQL
jgi:hypothetical protein